MSTAAAILGNDVQQTILEAVHECFVRYGLEKTSVENVASVAGLSRRTVYRYFRTRDGLVAAYVDWGAKRFHRLARSRLDRLPTFEAQMAELAVLARWPRATLGSEFGQVALDIHTATFFVGTMHSPALLRRSVDFLAPYVRAAQQRKELRSSLDVRQGAEWAARILFAMAELPSVTFDADRPAEIRRFVRRFLVRGLD